MMLTAQSPINTKEETTQKIGNLLRRQSGRSEDLLGIEIKSGRLSKDAVFEYLTEAYTQHHYLGSEIIRSLKAFLQEPEYKPRTLALMANALTSGRFSAEEKEIFKVLAESEENKELVRKALQSKKSEDRDFEYCAETIIEIFGEKSSDLIRELIKSTDNDEWFVHFEVKNAICKLGQHAVEGLIDVIGSRKFSGEHFASRCVRSYPEIALPLVIDKIKNGTKSERQHAISELGFCESVPQVCVFLMEYLKEQCYVLASKTTASEAPKEEAAAVPEKQASKSWISWLKFGTAGNSKTENTPKPSKANKPNTAKREIFETLENISETLASLCLIASTSSLTNDGRYIRSNLESNSDFDFNNRTAPNQETFSNFLQENNVFRLLLPAYIQYRQTIEAYDLNDAVKGKGKKPDPDYKSRALYRAGENIEEIISEIIINDETNLFAQKFEEYYHQHDNNLRLEILKAYENACDTLNNSLQTVADIIESIRPVQTTFWNLEADDHDSFSLMPDNKEKFSHLTVEGVYALSGKLSEKARLISEQLPGMVFNHDDRSLTSTKLHLASLITGFDKAVSEFALSAFRIEQDDFIRSSAVRILSQKMTKEEFWGFAKDILENETLGHNTRHTVNSWISNSLFDKAV